jgi:hypothetical protein
VGKRLSHDDFVALVADLSELLADVRGDGPVLLRYAREDLEAAGFPGSTRSAPGGHGISDLTGPERYAIAGSTIPRSVGRAEKMCDALRAVKRELGEAARAAGSSKPAGDVERAVFSREPITCVVCDEPTGRPRMGMCERHYKAWVRAGRPDVVVFRWQCRGPQVEAA